jgi:hypothetical protein
MSAQSANKDTRSNATNDFFLEVAKGVVPGHSAVIQRGHATSVSTSTAYSDFCEYGDLTYMSTAETMDIVSTSTSDSSDGTGLQTVLIQGIDNDGAALQETVTMNGTTPVGTSGEYKRINAMVGLSVGSDGWNAGDVKAISATSNTTQSFMGTVECLSQNSHYTVPTGSKGYLYKVELNAAKLSGGGTPVVEFAGTFRTSTSSAWLQGFDKKLDTGVTDEVDVVLPFPTQMPAGTDIRMRGRCDTASSEARTRMYLMLAEDNPANIYG